MEISIDVEKFRKIATLIAFIFGFALASFLRPTGAYLSARDAANAAINYLNNYYLHGQKASLLNYSDTGSGVYEIVLKIGDRTYTSYVTKDGKLLFPSAINLTNIPSERQSRERATRKVSTKTCEDLPKKKEPKLMAFVVSYCPFGLQMQRVFAKVVSDLPEAMKYLEIRYMGWIENDTIKSMHGQREAQENLRQICIREEQSEKYWDYLSCFIKSANSSSCLEQAGIDIEKLEACMRDSKRGLAYASEDFELQRKYRVTGSPTLILNDERVNEFNFGGRSAEAIKTILCCGFESKPEWCDVNLTAQQAARGFSQTYAGSSSSRGRC